MVTGHVNLLRWSLAAKVPSLDLHIKLRKGIMFNGFGIVWIKESRDIWLSTLAGYKILNSCSLY